MVAPAGCSASNSAVKPSPKVHMCREIDGKSTEPSGSRQSGGSVSEYGGLNVARRGPGYTQTRITSRIIAQKPTKSLPTARMAVRLLPQCGWRRCRQPLQNRVRGCFLYFFRPGVSLDVARPTPTDRRSARTTSRLAASPDAAAATVVAHSRLTSS